MYISERDGDYKSLGVAVTELLKLTSLQKWMCFTT